MRISASSTHGGPGWFGSAHNSSSTSWDRRTCALRRRGVSSERRRVCKGGRAGHLNQTPKKSSFKNLFFAHKVTVTKLFYVMMMATRDWSVSKKGWLTLRPRSRSLRLLQGTGTNSVYLTRSGDMASEVANAGLCGFWDGS